MAKTGLTTTQLIAAGALGVLTMVLTLPAYIVTNLLPIPAAGIPLAGFIASMMAVVILFSFRKFGALTASMLVYGVLSIPTPIGQIGFAPKVLAFLATGLTVDILYLIFRKGGKMDALVLGGATMVAITLALVALFIVLLPPVAKAYIAALNVMIPMAAVIGSLGGLLGRSVYLKIRSTAVVKRIQDRD